VTTDEPDPAAVAEAFGLPGPVTGWEPVGGAWSNRVYRLDAGGRRYAVKEMRNPWAEPRWQEWLAESWPASWPLSPSRPPQPHGYEIWTHLQDRANPIRWLGLT
jgi:hypothetical protein